MALERIEYGSLASSEMMNDNFEYLDDRISSLAETHSSDTSSLYSGLANLNTAMNQQNEILASDIDDLEEYAEAIRADFDAQNNAPDYSAGIGITLPYTVEQDGYVYAGVDGLDTKRYVYVNGSIVHGHSGYSGGYIVYSGSVFRVSAGDVVTCSKPHGNYYFYPMKGGE